MNISKARSDLKTLIESTVGSLEFFLGDRDDVFFTTSFGLQSALLVAMMKEAGLPLNCLYVKSPLANAGTDRQRDEIIRRFSFNLTVVDRTEWLKGQLKSIDFTDLGEDERAVICRDLKRNVVKDYIAKNNFEVWVSGIRRSQTKHRQSLRVLDVTDLGVVKLSPLAGWSDEEVGGVLNYLGLPVNLEYYDMCKFNSSRECGLHIV